jgi:hypothetical protein
MGLFRRRKQAEADPFGGTGYVPGAAPTPVPLPADASPPAPGADVHGPLDAWKGLGAFAAMANSSTTFDARGIPGLREDVMKLAMSGGTPDQIMATLREHGINLPDGVPVTMMNAATGIPLPGAPAAPGGEEDPAARLRKLQELRSGDLITEEELQAQRAKILGEL